MINRSKKSKTDLAGDTAIWLALALTFGYPIQASIPIMLHISSTPVNAGFRAIYVLVALILIFVALPKRKIISQGAFWLIIFWVIYSTRFVVDMSVRGIKYGSKETVFMYSMVFGSCVIPLIAVILNSKYILLNSIYKKLYGIVVVSNLILVMLILYQYGGISLALFSGRMEITGLNEDEHVINSIVIGLYGNVLFLLSIYSLMFIEHKRVLTRVLIGVLALVGFFNLLIAASRGPFITMIFLVLFMMYFKYKSIKTKLSFLFKTVGISLITIFLALSTGVLNNVVENFSLFGRLDELNSNIKSGGKETRNFEYQSALDQFYENPIVGDQYVTTYDNVYPHNIYLEILMSIGVLGMFVFLAIHYELYKRIVYIFKTKNHRFFLLLLVLLIVLFAAMTSGGIALAPELWMIMSLFFAIRYVNATKVKKRINNNANLLYNVSGR
jgi:O-antigen ligase